MFFFYLIIKFFVSTLNFQTKFSKILFISPRLFLWILLPFWNCVNGINRVRKQTLLTEWLIGLWPHHVLLQWTTDGWMVFIYAWFGESFIGLVLRFFFFYVLFYFAFLLNSKHRIKCFSQSFWHKVKTTPPQPATL